MIPKKGGIEDLKDFHPINLMGSLYKLLAKVLANRLKMVMSSLVNKAQNAFVIVRQILDASLIANKVIDSMVKKERGILCKLDIEKAYDSINWKFLFGVLQKMGFGPKWVSWIKQCVSTASFSILVHGSLAGFFNSSRGLIQGDPLSLYLFVLGMEVFSILMEKAVRCELYLVLSTHFINLLRSFFVLGFAKKEENSRKGSVIAYIYFTYRFVYVKREKGDSLIFIMLKKRKENYCITYWTVYIHMLMGPTIQ